MTIAITNIGSLVSAFSPINGPDPILLLGAGASLKSGIPLSGELVEQAARWAYCRSHLRHPEDPTVRRSDWQPWLQEHTWYKTTDSFVANYSSVIEHLLQPREVRKEFFLKLISPGVPASLGYQRLVDFMADDVVRTVLTTNFDSVLVDLCHSRQRPHYVSVVKTTSDYVGLSTAPAHPQVVYLHGSVEHYTDKNLLNEVQRLDEGLVGHLEPMLRDHPLIVVGYRGAEPSIMRHLLIGQAEKSDFRHGVFWCTRSISSLDPLVYEFAERIGGNFQLVAIEGFDELLDDLWGRYEQSPQTTSRVVALKGSQKVAPTFDLRMLLGAHLDELDWSRVQTTIVAYCQHMKLPVPQRVDRHWLVERLIEYELAVEQNNEVFITNAGFLLFARQPSTRMSGAELVLRVDGEPQQLFEGNLWSQLDALMDALVEVNRPFRLKGPISETVYPYPPLALKEVVVNALVHRSYELKQSVVVEVRTDRIRVSSPGGLIPEVVRQVEPTTMQERIARGERGIKGYRNAVLADLFYGAGAMDKAGSGLADVQLWVRQNEGVVTFGANQDNTVFEVNLYPRPEAVGKVMGIASPVVTRGRFIGNLLEIIDMPPHVWHVSSRVRRIRDVWQETGATSLPPFILHGDRLVSFANPVEDTLDLRSVIESGTSEALNLEEFAGDEDGERHLVWLLNECLRRFLDWRGLMVDNKRHRAYFPRTDVGPREITYQARLRRATRTVTKPIISRNTQQVAYWEHESVAYGFERYGATWALQLVPGYVFTKDGGRQLLDSPRIGPLSTRRAARDYNPNVYNDLTFWAWVLSGGLESITLDTGGEFPVVLRAQLASFEARDVAPPADGADLEMMPYQSTGIEGELAAIAKDLIMDSDWSDDDASNN